MKPTILLAAALGAGIVTSTQHSSIWGEENWSPAPNNSVSDGTITVGPPGRMVLDPFDGPRITRCSLLEGKLILTYERTDGRNVFWAIDGVDWPAKRKHVWREIYACGTNGIVLERVEHAKVTPPRTVTTPEKIEWGVEAKE